MFRLEWFAKFFPMEIVRSLGKLRGKARRRFRDRLVTDFRSRKLRLEGLESRSMLSNMLIYAPNNGQQGWSTALAVTDWSPTGAAPYTYWHPDYDAVFQLGTEGCNPVMRTEFSAFSRHA